MAVRDIAIACQGGGSHAAYTGGVLPVLLKELDNLRVAREANDALELPGDPEVDALVAISGTSGGAISALLGWYGFITGGAQDAERRLDDFWSANSALKWTEAQLNHMARMLSDLSAGWGWDIKSSPYALPMAGLEFFSASVWPALAATLGANNPWMRPDWLALPELLRPGVDWSLIGAYGEFASIPLEVQRWTRSELQGALFPFEAAVRERFCAERFAIEERIAAKLDCAGQVLQRLDALGLGDETLLRAAFQRWHPPTLRFDPAVLAELAQSVQRVTRHIPQLLIGAVELHQGEFLAFSAERAPGDGGVSLEAVLASAAVPWLFRAQELTALDERTLVPRQLMLWDGLFSQNPPIKNFLAGVLDDSKKPDEIWVVQINPTVTRAQPGTKAGMPGRILFDGGEIWDLRNALAGNLALNQELGFVDAINRRMDEAPGTMKAARAGPGKQTQRIDRQVQVDRIVMDGDAVGMAAGAALGANSKLDRDPGLREALFRHGQLQGRRYLGLRSRVAELCGNLDQTLARACGVPDPGESEAPSAGSSAAASPAPRSPGAALVLDGATVYSVASEQANAPQAVVRWRSVGLQIGGRPVRIEGQSELAEMPDSGTSWRLKEASITTVTPLAERLALPARPVRSAPPQARPRTRAPAETRKH